MFIDSVSFAASSGIWMVSSTMTRLYYPVRLAHVHVLCGLRCHIKAVTIGWNNRLFLSYSASINCKSIKMLLVISTRDNGFEINHIPSLGIDIGCVSSWDFSKTNWLRGEVMGTARAADTCTCHSAQIQVNKQSSLGGNEHGIPFGHTLILWDTMQR